MVIKDLQVALLPDMWFEAVNQAGFDIAIVIALRHPREAIASWSPHARISPELAKALWLKFNLLAERNTRGLPRVFVEYANVLDDWRREAKRISAALPIDLDTRDDDAIDEFLTPDLRRQRHCDTVTELDDRDLLCPVYAALHAAARDERWDESALDRVLEEYRTSQDDDFRVACKEGRGLANRMSLKRYNMELVRIARIVKARLA